MHSTASKLTYALRYYVLCTILLLLSTQRIDARRREHIKQRSLDSKRLLQRNRNVQAVLEAKQSVEGQKLVAEIRKSVLDGAVTAATTPAATHDAQVSGSHCYCLHSICCVYCYTRKLQHTTFTDNCANCLSMLSKTETASIVTWSCDSSAL
jgi:hypothetical protein